MFGFQGQYPKSTRQKKNNNHMRSNPKTPNTYKGILWNALKQWGWINTYETLGMQVSISI